MDPSSVSPGRTLRIPRIVWAALAIVVAGVAAVSIFRVPSDLAVTYGFIALMVILHFGMHAGHGAHGAHDHKTDADGGTYGAQETEDRPSGGCH